MGFELIPAIRISSSALKAEQTRMEVTANNMANINTTRTPEGGPYKRRIPVFESVMRDTLEDLNNDMGGVKVDEIIEDNRTPIEVYAPYHPDADANGMVKMPNISPVEEMVDMMNATRGYEANLAIIKESKKMAEKTIDLLKT